MKLHTKTWALVALLALLLVVNFADRGTGQRIAASLPAIEKVDRDQAMRIEISSAIEKVILKRAEPVGDQPGRWTLVSPVKGDADQILVRSLFAQFRKDVPVDIKVDEGNLADYGLDAGTGIVVEIWQSGEDPVLSFTIGNDAPGGSTFIRMSGDNAIYRARIGGRQRYDRRGADWRNAVVLDFDSEAVAGLEVERDGRTRLSLTRLPSTATDDNDLPLPGAWTLDPIPAWPVDTEAIEALVRRLGSMRAGDTLDPSFDGGFEPPAAVVTIVLFDGTTRTLSLGTRPGDGGTFVKVDGKEEIFRVATSGVEGLLKEPGDFRDRRILSFKRQDVDTISLEEGSQNILLQQDLSNGLWRVIQPANVDVDLKLVFFMVNTLADLRADDVSAVRPKEAGLSDPSAIVRVRLLDGSSVALLLGDTVLDSRNRPSVYVQREGDSQVFLLRTTQVQRIKQGFGRS